MDSEQIIYYQKRAKEYELVYKKLERQNDLSLIKDYLCQQFIDKSIIEIACGTGYWTEILSSPAKSILASDINLDVIQIAQTKNYPKSNVTFEIQAIEDLKNVRGVFEGLFGGFIWSHIKKEELLDFLSVVLNQVQDESEIIFLDNKYVQGSSSPIVRTDKNGNTFQIRELESGEKYEIIKNFPDPDETKNMIDMLAEGFEWIDFEYYWIMKFKKRQNAS